MVSKLVSPAPTSKTRASKVSLGLDIGTHVAKLVAVACQCHSSDCPPSRVLAASSLRLPEAAAGDSNVLVEALKPWLRELTNFGCSSYQGCLPSSVYDYETLDLSPDAAADEIEGLAVDTIHQLLGDQASAASFDYWTSSCDGQGSSLHLVWTPADFAQQIAGQIACVGLRCSALDAPAVALARLSKLADSTDGQLVVDIGCGEATFVWSRNGLPEYLRNRIRFAPASAVETLAQHQEISLTAAETLLQDWGIGDSRLDSLAEFNHTFLEEWLEQLLFEFQRTIRHLLTKHGPKAIRQVALCGGGACIKGLDKWLSERLEIQIELAAAPENCQWDAAEPYSPLYAQVLSLALQGGSA